MSEYRKVEQSEWDAFMEANHGELLADTVAMCDPPMRFYYRKGVEILGYDSAVAKRKMNTSMHGHPDYAGEPDDFYIRRTP
jgi:hypothetical protein